MGVLAARFFAYVQSAALYRDLHHQAVALLPQGNGLSWLDVGCGPGLVVRYAHTQGYVATGVDIDPAMIREARRIAKHMRLSTRFEVAGLDDISPPGYDIVSAASLLIVIKDRRAALESLKSLVQLRGTLLIIETTRAFTFSNTWAHLNKVGFGGRNWVMLLWALVRRRARFVEAADFVSAGWTADRHELMPGVDAWLLRPPQSRSNGQ